MINNAASPNAATTTIIITGSNDEASDVAPPTTTRDADGSVNFENQNYTINVRDTGEINVTNKLTAETYWIGNDLRVDVDGVHSFSFEGTTTFELDDGTKVIIDTEPKKEVVYGPLVSSVLMIIDGLTDYGVQISGLDSNKKGELTFIEAHDDELSQWEIDEGNALDENLAGSGFIAIDPQGNIVSVDQKWIDNTDQVKVWASALFNQHSGMVNFLSGISQITFLCSLPSAGTYGDFNVQDRHPKPIKRELRPQLKTEQPGDMTTFAKRQPGDALSPAANEIKYRIHFVLSRIMRPD